MDISDLSKPGASTKTPGVFTEMAGVFTGSQNEHTHPSLYKKNRVSRAEGVQTLSISTKVNRGSGPH